MTELTWSDTDWQNASTTDVTVENGSFQLAGAIPESGLLHEYRFNDDSDTSVAIDSAGSDNADIVGGASYTTDAKEGDYAISLDGTDGSVRTAHSAPNGDLSFAFWFKTTDDGVEFLSQWISQSSSDAFGPYVGIGNGNYGGTSGSIHFGWRWSNKNANQVSTQSTGWNDGVYHHVAVTLDASPSSATDAATIYVDGADEPLNSDESQGSGSDFDNDSIYYGEDQYQGTFANTKLDRPLEYDRILSASEVSEIYNAYA
jgi:hypothetical protein